MKTDLPGQLSLFAADTTPTTLSLTAKAVIDLEAKGADGQPKRPTFTITGYTGAVMNLAGFSLPVIVDLAGLKANRERIPILLDHDSGRIIGQTDGITIDASSVQLTGTITGDDSDSVKVTTHARNGFEWQASIGASIVRQEFLKAGEKAVVNGREVAGPLLIAREARLHETSFVAIGADHQTVATVAASSPLGIPLEGHAMTFDDWVKAKGFDPAAVNDVQRASLQAMYDAEHKAAAAPPPPTTTTVVSASPTLDDIVNARREEDKRIKEITQITADAINERPGMVDEFERMARVAIEAKSTKEEFELAVLRASRYVAAPNVIVRGEPKAGQKAIEAAVCRAGGLHNIEAHFDAETLNRSADAWPNGLGLRDLFMTAARDNGYRGQDSRDFRTILEYGFGRNIQAQGWSTISLPGILGNTANKFLRDGFNAVESTWQSIASRGTARDFKAMTTYSLTGDFRYEKVGPGGELKHATVGEETYTMQVETYGKMFAITRQHLINDDLNALTTIPRKLGRGAALALNLAFWTEFMDNSTFFTTARGNYFEGAATNLQLSSLTTAETLFMNQTDPDGYPTAITPRILLVPNALAVTAANLMNSTQIAGDTTANTITLSNNPHAGKFRVVSSAYLSNTAITGNSTTAWYLLADPSDLAVIEVAFLNGKDTPTVESAEADFNTLGVQFRGFHDWGVNLQEYRGGVKSKGAA